MRTLIKLAIGIALTWWACWLLDWPYGYLSWEQFRSLFLLLLAGSIMNMRKT